MTLCTRCNQTAFTSDPCLCPVVLPKKAPPRVTEATILRRIREAFGALPYVLVFRNNTGMLKDRNGTNVKFGLCEGSSDLIGMVSPRVGGVARFFALEVKQPGKKPTKVQTAFIEMVNKKGGYAGWCDSVEGALDHANKARL